jgi:hypothetical protein
MQNSLEIKYLTVSGESSVALNLHSAATNMASSLSGASAHRVGSRRTRVPGVFRIGALVLLAAGRGVR